MSVSMAILYKDCTKQYRMKLLAGSKGLNNLVKWVHIIEDEEVSNFLHGGELVFTAGIKSNKENWLLHFVEKLHMSSASAVVVNIGPYIGAIPKEVMLYCDAVNLPLFTIPWETRMVDMTREFCEKIFRSETIEENMSSTIQNILFQIGDMETQILQMERNGFQRDSTFCFLCITIKEMEPLLRIYTMEILERNAEKVARAIKDLHIHFIYKEKLILVLVEYTWREVELFVETYMLNLKTSEIDKDIFIGISSNVKGIDRQQGNFQNALEVSKMAEHKEQFLIYYDKIDFYKILMQVKDRTILIEYYNELVGKVVKYDEENGTNLVHFLRCYIENDGSPGRVAANEFIHRNTVNNMLKKVEKITGYNMLLLDSKVKCTIGMWIYDIVI